MLIDPVVRYIPAIDFFTGQLADRFFYSLRAAGDCFSSCSALYFFADRLIGLLFYCILLFCAW
jgi:hypothetical protein